MILSRAFTIVGLQSHLKAVDRRGTDLCTQFQEPIRPWNLVCAGEQREVDYLFALDASCKTGWKMPGIVGTQQIFVAFSFFSPPVC